MLEVKNLTKIYRNFNGEHTALKKVNFYLGNSGMVFLFGASGMGKSTLVNIMAGLDIYDDGEVLYNGVNLMDMEQKERDIYRSREIALIFEKNNLIDSLTIEENIKVAMELAGTEPTDEEVKKVLSIVKLDGYEKRRINELSSGELQRVVIARVLVLKPRIIFADEPTANLDAENSRIFWKALKDYSKEALVIGVAHSRETVEKYADRIIEIDKGQVVKDVYFTNALANKDKSSLEALNKQQEKQHLEGKPNNLGAKHSSKIGFKFLMKNKFKFVSMCVLVSLTLMMFAMSYLVSIFDNSYVLAKATLDRGDKYISFEVEDDKEITLETLNKIYSSNIDNEIYRFYKNIETYKFNNDKEHIINGFMAVTQEGKYNKIGQKVLHGEYPNSLSSANTIAISDYFANLMLANGAMYYEGENSFVMNNANCDLEHIINKTIKIGEVKFIIGAIYETDYKNYVNVDFTPIRNREEDFDYFNKAVYSVIHVSPNKALEIINSQSIVFNANLTLSKGENISRGSFTLTNKTASEGLDYITNYNAGNKLNANEVIIPVNVFNSLYDCEVPLAWNASALEFNSATSAAGTKIVLTTAYGYSQELTVVGLTDGNEIILANNEDNSSQGCIGGVIQHAVYPITNLIVPVKDTQVFTNQISYLNAKGLKYTGRYGEELVEITDTINTLKIAFMLSTAFLGLFSLYLIFSSFLDIAVANKKSIGSLRTMGANSLNLFGIFSVSCFILALIGIFGGAILGCVGSAIVNAVISKAYSLPLSILNVNFGMFCFTTLIGIGITVVGSLIPISVYCGKTPVEVMKK